MWKKIKKLSPALIVLLVIAWIWIPTGTPDDLLTTIPIIKYVGWNTFFIVSIVLLLLIWLNGGKQLFRIIRDGETETMNAFQKFFIANRKGFYAGVIGGVVASLLYQTANIQLIITIFLISIIAGILFNIILDRTKTMEWVFYVLGIIGLISIFRQLQIVPLSTFQSQVYIQPLASLPTGVSNAMGKGTLISVLGGVSALLFRLNPIIMAVFIGIVFLFFGVPAFLLGFKIIENFNLILLMLGAVSIILLLFKFRRR